MRNSEKAISQNVNETSWKQKASSRRQPSFITVELFFCGRLEMVANLIQRAHAASSQIGERPWCKATMQQHSAEQILVGLCWV